MCVCVCVCVCECFCPLATTFSRFILHQITKDSLDSLTCGMAGGEQSKLFDQFFTSTYFGLLYITAAVVYVHGKSTEVAFHTGGICNVITIKDADILFLLFTTNPLKIPRKITVYSNDLDNNFI